MTVPDERAPSVIQHLISHDGEVGDVVWPLPHARWAVDLWLGAAGDAAASRVLAAGEARAARWKVFDADPAEGHPLFVVVDGVSPAPAELLDAVAAAIAGTTQPVLLLTDEPGTALTMRLQAARWRLTDARRLLAVEP